MVKTMNDNGISQPAFNDYLYWLGSDIVNGWTILIHGLYGNEVSLTEYEKLGNQVTYTLNFKLYDIYGVDNGDTNLYQLAGFRSWHILQHWDGYEGKYRPFITYMEFEKTFTTTLH